MSNLLLLTLGIIAFVMLVFVLLITEISVTLSYTNGKFEAWYSIGKFRRKIKRLSHGTDTDKKQTAQKAEKDFTEKSVSLTEKITTFCQIYRHATRLTQKYLHVRRFRAKVVFGTGDAALTAINAGMLWTVVSNITALLNDIVFIPKPKLSVVPKFNEICFKAEVNCIISARIVNIIFIAAVIFFKYKSRKGKEE